MAQPTDIDDEEYGGISSVPLNDLEKEDDQKPLLAAENKHQTGLETEKSEDSEAGFPEHESWMQSLSSRQSILDEQEREAGSNFPVIFKVDPGWRADPSLTPQDNQSDENFDPVVINLGLYGIFTERPRSLVTLSGDLKVDVILKFLELIGKASGDWKEISALVVPKPLDMKRRYDGHWDLDVTTESIQSHLAADAIFLASTFSYHLLSLEDFTALCLRNSKLLEFYTKLRRSIFVAVFEDALKLENQIPLELIRNALAIMIQSLTSSVTEQPSFESCLVEANEKLDTICKGVVENVYRSSFPSSQVVGNGVGTGKLYECHHLLHCLAQTLWDEAKFFTPPELCKAPVYSVAADGQAHILRNQARLTASQLQRMGIEFRGHGEFWPRFRKHALFPWKATLFLPSITAIDDTTEERWKNLLAFEGLYRRRSSRPFMAFLSFMDDLINTEEDVSILCSGKDPVILYNGLGDNKAVADLFNLITNKHFEKLSAEISLVQSHIYDYASTPFRHFWSAFGETVSHRPWLPLSIFAAISLLVLTVLQTAYTIKSFQHG